MSRPRHRHHRLRASAVSLSVILAASLAACTSPSALDFGDESVPLTLGIDETETAPPIADDTDDSALSTSNDPIAEPNDEVADSPEVEAAFRALLERWIGCFHQPARCDINRLTARDSPERTRLGEAIAFYSAEQIRTKPNDGRLEWAIESLSLPSNDRARLVVCEYDTRVFFDSSLADTALGDIIFDTTIWTRRVEWVLANEDQSWRLFSRRIERRSPVARFCTP